MDDGAFYEVAVQLPKTIYAIRVKGSKKDGEQWTRTHFFAKKSDYASVMESLSKYPEGLVMKTFEGTVEWTK